MSKTAIGKGGRPLDVNATKAAQKRHAIGVARLRSMFGFGEPEAKKRNPRDFSLPLPRPTKARRRHLSKLARKARKANRR